jgi:surfactin synthase thioesterase subunit
VGEPSLTRLPDLVTALLDETEFEPPFVFFGHSLGALVAFETARALRARGRTLPRRLIVSAHAAPGTRRRRPRWHTLPDDELIRVLNGSYDGLPEYVSADPYLLAMSLQAIRSDFELLDAHRPRTEDPLAVPIDALYGEADTVPVSAIELWRQHTAGAFRMHRFPGGHFYFRHVDIFDVLGPLVQGTAAADCPSWSPRPEGG